MVKLLGIVGAGQLGTGLALLASSVGRLHVKLIDTCEEHLSRSHMLMEHWLRRQQAIAKLDSKDYYEVMHRMSVSANIEDIRHADFVIEAATENYAVKSKICTDLDKILPPNVCIASNTNSLSITKLASCTKRPDRVIGMHFMNPPTAVKLVEIVPGLQTSQETIVQAQSLAERLDKEYTLSKDRPGFIANKIIYSLINESINSLNEGIATKEDIDKSVKLALNLPSGPLEMADYLGLDLILDSLRVYHRELGEEKYKPSPLLINYVNAGRVGRKAGRGFYEYSTS
jgi:3-hydroxybutyryl-CoA dehydrogenase